MPVLTLPLSGQNLGFPGAMQFFLTNKSQNVPALQMPAPGQHTPPAGAQLNLFGHRKNPGWPGQGGPVVAVNSVPGSMVSFVFGAIVMYCTTVPGPGSPADLSDSALGDLEWAMQSPDSALLVAFRMKLRSTQVSPELEDLSFMFLSTKLN